ncbi:hypothetical protein DTO212C5_2404 [Paecilomyces variotii]|nr:hypothetical protein DTO212C5_2404 [Paecilomyces variotii]
MTLSTYIPSVRHLFTTAFHLWLYPYPPAVPCCASPGAISQPQETSMMSPDNLTLNYTREINMCNDTNSSFPLTVPFHEVMIATNTTVDFPLSDNNSLQPFISVEASPRSEVRDNASRKWNGSVRDIDDIWPETRISGELREIWREDRDTILQIVGLLVLWVLFCRSNSA